MNERTHLGNVAVDSGSLAIHDPSYTGELVAKLNPTEDSQAIEFDNGSAGAAVVAHIPGGDGVYPVYLEQDDDGRYQLRIELNWIPTEEQAAAIEQLLKPS